MITPNSRARKEGKERGEVKGECWRIMMMIAPNSRAHKGGDVKGQYGRVWGEKEGNADYGGMVQPSQQHVAPCVKDVEWG